MKNTLYIFILCLLTSGTIFSQNISRQELSNGCELIRIIKNEGVRPEVTYEFVTSTGEKGEMTAQYDHEAGFLFVVEFGINDHRIYCINRAPYASVDGILPVYEWTTDNLDDELVVETIARHHAQNMSEEKIRNIANYVKNDNYNKLRKKLGYKMFGQDEVYSVSALGEDVADDFVKILKGNQFSKFLKEDDYSALQFAFSKSTYDWVKKEKNLKHVYQLAKNGEGLFDGFDIDESAQLSVSTPLIIGLFVAVLAIFTILLVFSGRKKKTD